MTNHASKWYFDAYIFAARSQWYWNHGERGLQICGLPVKIGTEILGLTLRFAFDNLHVHKVFARAFADNPASIGSFLKGGFAKEAYLKDEVYVNGQYRDIVLLGIINPNEG